MCMPCCVFTYAEFRMENGELDDVKWHELMREYDKAYPDMPEERKIKLYLNPCDCECHRKGSHILH